MNYNECLHFRLFVGTGNKKSQDEPADNIRYQVAGSRDLPRFDLILRGGHVLDPANGLDGPYDVGASVSGK